MNGWYLVRQDYCYICKSPQKRIHKKCKETSNEDQCTWCEAEGIVCTHFKEPEDD